MSEEVQRGIYDGVSIEELMTLTAETAATHTTDHCDYQLLAGRIVIENMHKNTSANFSGELIYKQ